jgi:cytochrome c oxidase cbb3-type subunit 2
MNHFRFIFLGFLATFASAWLGLVILPTIHYGKEAAALPQSAPSAERDAVRRGEQIYAANGCVYCHSQQVRSPNFGNDDKRGWGSRRTVAADYLGDAKAMMGTMRTGPDLANIGQRMPSTAWHFQHLFNPVSTSPGSIMPPYRFLFERKTVTDGKPETDAIPVGSAGERTDAEGQQWVPTAEARDLVAYLLSQKRSLADRPEASVAPARRTSP